ncbi:MAG: 2OG-Fe(II) oxygenase, partial [Parvularculaceae bacterium]
MSAALKLVEHVPTADDVRWAAVERRDKSADGSFWSCVKTTGVYCLPSCAGRPKRQNVVFVDTQGEARALGYRPCKRCRPDRFIAGTLSERIGGIDWSAAEDRLNAEGWAMLGRLLTDEECAALIDAYGDDARYRSTVVMRRHGFGEGEYRYFADPAPEIVAMLRQRIYERLAPIANRWADMFGAEKDYPAHHVDYRKLCARAGQKRPTPLILK